MRPVAAVALPAAVALLAATAGAAEPTRGAVLAAPCTTCHQPAAGALASFPPLQGRPADELTGLLLGYRSGALVGTIMNRLAAGYSEDELRAIAEAVSRGR